MQCKTYQAVGENCCDFTGWLSLQGGAIVGNHWTKSQDPHGSSGLEVGGIVANEWCIMAIRVIFHLLPLTLLLCNIH